MITLWLGNPYGWVDNTGSGCYLLSQLTHDARMRAFTDWLSGYDGEYVQYNIMVTDDKSYRSMRRITENLNTTTTVTPADVKKEAGDRFMTCNDVIKAAKKRWGDLDVKHFEHAAAMFASICKSD